MGLDFSRPQNSVQTAVLEAENGVEVVEKYDIVADRQQMNTELTGSPEVDALASQIQVYDLETIVSFGSEVAEEISKASDVVLNSMNLSQLDDSSAMLNQLAKIMSKFDIEEIKENPTLFGKLFGNLRKQLDKILDKYHTMGEEVDKIYVQLKQYESEIKQSNRKLNQALMMLEQRTQDLRIAENVAMQSIPMIKTMEFSNMNLVRKINSAFIITLPVFKQALAQAIMLKRQRIQAEAMSALDEKTNEMLIRNARNTVEQSKMTAQLASGSSIRTKSGFDKRKPGAEKADGRSGMGRQRV